MDILVTGAGTTYGNGWADILSESHAVTCLGAEPHPSIETVVADRREYEQIRSAVEGTDAIVDLPPRVEADADWDLTHRMVGGTFNLLRAAEETGVERYVVGSTNKVVQGYELDHAPDLYGPDYAFTVDHTAAPRPTKWYAVGRLYAEHLARMYVERTDWRVGRQTVDGADAPERVYVIRWGSVRLAPGMDHPYSDAEYGVEEGLWDRDSRQYDLAVRRMKATWLSRDDLRRLLDCVLADDSVTYDVFYGVSANERRWLDIQHAREVLGYDPVDDGETWTGPPDPRTRPDRR